MPNMKNQIFVYKMRKAIRVGIILLEKQKKNSDLKNKVKKNMHFFSYFDIR